MRVWFINWPITGTSGLFSLPPQFFLHMNIYVNIYDKYIYFKSYHDDFMFCSLFIDGAKMWLRYTRAKIYTYARIDKNTPGHEYSTQRNALFCIILLYKMLEMHVCVFKLCG